MTNSDVASNFNADVDTALADALRAGGGNSLVNFSPFPDGTTYTPANLSVVFDNRVASSIQAPGGGAIATGAPEPASLTLVSIGALGLLGYGWRRRK
jgi:hypothetical protein